jgi:hypothetical protein
MPARETLIKKAGVSRLRNTEYEMLDYFTKSIFLVALKSPELIE